MNFLVDIMWRISKSHFHISHLYSLKLNFIHYHYFVIFTLKSMSICND